MNRTTFVACAHCGDPASDLGDAKEWRPDKVAPKHLLQFGNRHDVLVDDRKRPCCLACWAELVCGAIPKVTSKRGCARRGPRTPEPSPADENAVRALEDHDG